jgi:Raf kinase inhibitor-like YbhB/YbcL family protein
LLHSSKGLLDKNPIGPQKNTLGWALNLLKFDEVPMRILCLFALFLSFALLSPLSAQAGMTLSSTDIAPDTTISNDYVYNNFGCTGKNISPALTWENAPKDTKSFAVTVYDPDAPTGSGWWHWIIYDLGAFSTGVPRGMGSGAMSIPKYAHQATNDYGQASYGGPCPPVGSKPHRYIFTVYALKVEKLNIPAGATAAMVGFALNANTIEKAELTALYGR